MRTLILTVMAAMVSFWAANAQTEKVNYVVTSADTIFCGEMNVGASKTTITLEDGIKLKLENKNLVRYSRNGRYFQKLPVYVRNHKTDKNAMMELVQFKNRVKVFKEERYDITCDALNAYFYYYVGGKCIQVDKNPTFADVVEFVDQFECVNPGYPNERNLARQ